MSNKKTSKQKRQIGKVRYYKLLSKIEKKCNKYKMINLIVLLLI